MVAFGTSGLRGLATDLTEDLVADATAAFLTRLAPGQPLALARDLRASSPRISEAVARAALALGRDVHDLGEQPTPALALAAGALGAAGIMVTGSHIPADRNGLKFYLGADEITKSDEEAVLSGPLKQETSAPGTRRHAAATYVARYAEFFGPDALGGLTIGVYQQSSVARDIMVDLVRQCGGTVVPLGRSDSFIPIDTETLEPEIHAQLRSWAAAQPLDAIISTDGDADRPLITDASGLQLAGDSLGPLVAQALSATHVVAPVSANTLVDEMGVFKVTRTKIGSPYVIEAMRPLMEAGASVLGYEPNGGILLGFEANRQARRLAPLLTRDAMLPLLSVLSLMRERHLPLADLAKALPKRVRIADRIKGIDAAASQGLIAALLRGESEQLGLSLPMPSEINRLEGARLQFPGGEIVHIRPSGNAPELRCYVETDSEEHSAALMAQTMVALRDMFGR